MGLYDIKLYRTDVKVRLVDHLSVTEMGIDELVCQISDQPGLVAVDLKGFDESNDAQLSSGPKLLLLHAKDRCLIVNFAGTIPKALRLQLLSNEKYFFVGMDIDSKVLALENYYTKNFSVKVGDSFMKMRAGIGELAARVCKKAELRQFDGLRDLGNKVGIDFPKEITSKVGSVWPPKDGTVFTDEEIKYAICEAYMC